MVKNTIIFLAILLLLSGCGGGDHEPECVPRTFVGPLNPEAGQFYCEEDPK